jgi:hypothetical protein
VQKAVEARKEMQAEVEERTEEAKGLLVELEAARARLQEAEPQVARTYTISG